MKMMALTLMLLGSTAPARVDAKFTPTQVLRGDQADARGRVPDLDGTWYLSGDEGSPCEINQRRGSNRARFTNENGEAATGVIRGNRISVRDWGDPRVGLQGTIRGDTIRWSNGTYWSR
jgi:hypothetical protein